MSLQFQSPFCRAVTAVFKGWTALQLAVEHSFGGSQSRSKAEWFVTATEQWLQENNDVDSYEMEEFLAEIMSSEFNTMVDDNSLAEVATKVCRFYDLAKSGRIEELNTKVNTLKKAADVSSSQRQHNDDDDDDDDDMEIDSHNVMSHINALELNGGPENVVDTTPDGDNEQIEDNSPSNAPTEDDGWTTVTKGGRKKR